MKKLIVANLKMNLTLEEANDYLDIIKKNIIDQLEIIICPSFPFLPLFKNKDYKLGAQNCYYLDKGSYTGEVSPLQLKTIGVSYIIVGHSERRIYFKENNELINDKLKAILKHNIKPILCIGETMEERLLHKTFIVLKKQLNEALKDIESDMLTDIVIAYEPVWAIGSGKTPTSQEIAEVINYIKDLIKKEYKIDNIIVLYGGSVNLKNIKAITNIADGVLIGSASVDADNFINMINKII
ncbi:MAG: triose-phosphate isomerase [Bacilli bacterium]